jgi:SAM-dependent methyltransferase
MMETASTKQTTDETKQGGQGRAPLEGTAPDRNFRFYDNRQKYLLFVNTCAEKSAVADRIAQELPNIRPTPPAVRVFDAGIGDGTVLTRVMRWMHQRFPTLPFYFVGKEISLEDVRLALERMPDRFFEHPATVLVLTNLYYKEAPWLTPSSDAAASSLVWHEVGLSGTTSRDFEEQITALQPFLAANWRTAVNKATGNPTYVHPTVLVIYREDQKFQLTPVIPRRTAPRADYDLVIASQPYRLRAPLEFKASKVIAPLAKSLAPGGRLIGVHSHGGDPGQEIIRGMWPGENPFIHDRKQMLKATKDALGKEADGLEFNEQPDERALFRYAMHTLPSEVDETIGTSTAFAAWNAAIYVGQIEDARLDSVLGSRKYLDVTREVLRKHGGLWFWDEAFSITRRRD